uniref:Translation initiation factor 5A C-terminal domain-containing protein n=1 Tax=Oryza nivara TaxID=4536 RepID=A0A0E0GPS5_ORYNI
MFHMNHTNYQLIDISEDGLFVSLLTESGNTKDDLGLPTETISWGRSRLDLVKARKEEEIYALKDIGTKVHVANILITGKYAEDLYSKAEAGTIRKNGYIVIKNHPCKVVEVSTSKTSKHGHAKCHFVAKDIVPSSHNCDVPHVNRTEYKLIFVSLLTRSGNNKDDLRLPTYDNLLGQIKTGFGEGKDVVVTVMSAMGRSRSDFTDKGLMPVFEDRTSPTKEIEISILLMALRAVSIH